MHRDHDKDRTVMRRHPGYNGYQAMSNSLDTGRNHPLLIITTFDTLTHHTASMSADSRFYITYCMSCKLKKIMQCALGLKV